MKKNETLISADSLVKNAILLPKKVDTTIIKDIKSVISKADFILILIIISTCLISFLYIMTHNDYDRVEIFVDNELFLECELDRDQIIKINEHNTIEIKNQKVRMLHSDCKNQQCVKMGWSDQMPIICVPNKVSVKFKSNKVKEKKVPMIISY